MASKSPLSIVEFSPEKLDEIVQFQNSSSPPHRQMPRSHIESDLTDSARGRGSHVRLCYEVDQLTGYCGWVLGESGEFFVAPFVVSTLLAAQTLLKIALEAGHGQEWARVTCSLTDLEKRAAIVEMNFKHVFDFVEFEIEPSAFTSAISELRSGHRLKPLNQTSALQFAKLHNAAFTGVDNSLPMTEAQAQEFLAAKDTAHELSFAIVDEGNEVIAYALVKDDGYVDSIGVSPVFQGQNLGTMLFQTVLKEAARRNFKRLFTTVSSRNEASVRLHRRLGFRELERRTVFQKTL